MRPWSIALASLAALFVAGPSAFAEEAPSIRGLKLVVPDARGKPGTGTQQITKAVRRALAEGVGPLIPSKNLAAAQKKLKQKGKRLTAPEALAEAARKIDAQYVLSIEVTKEKWVYTARAMLINVETGQVQMDFRSQFFKPKAEADDRGKRIGARTIQKLEQLSKEGPPLAIASAGVAKPSAKGGIPLGGAPAGRPPPSDSGKLPPGDEPDLKTEPAPSASAGAGGGRSGTGGEIGGSAGTSVAASPSPGASSASTPGSGTSATVGITPVEVGEAPEILRFTVTGGAGLLHTYDLSAATIGNSRLSYRLDPLALVAAGAELVVPGVPIGVSLRAAYRPVRFQVTTDPAPAPQTMTPRMGPKVVNPSGLFLDGALLLEGHVALSGSGRQTFKLIPAAGIKYERISVDQHPGNVILSSTALAPIGGITLRMPINEVLEIGIGVDGGPIISFKESPSCSGRAVDTANCNGAKSGLTIGGALNARIWLSSAIGIAFDTRFDYDRVKFDGTATRQPPPNEPLDNVSTVTKDLRTAIGIALRL